MLQLPIWRFPEMGVTPNHPFSDFPWKSHHPMLAWGTMTTEAPIQPTNQPSSLQQSRGGGKGACGLANLWGRSKQRQNCGDLLWNSWDLLGTSGLWDSPITTETDRNWEFHIGKNGWIYPSHRAAKKYLAKILDELPNWWWPAKLDCRMGDSCVYIYILHTIIYVYTVYIYVTYT